MSIKSLVGNKYGKLTVILLDKCCKGKTFWKCSCACGNECVIRSDSLKRGKTKSCGCIGKVNLTDQLIDEAYNAYINQHLSANVIAKKYNCSPYTILRKFREKGFKIKDISLSNRKYPINESIFDIIDTEEKAYWLGFLYADGNVTLKNRTYTTRLSLSEQDKDMVERFSLFIFGVDRTKCRVITKSRRQNMVYVDVCNLHIAKTLSKLGCMPKKTQILTFPGWLDVSLHNHFVRGYFDGDGCIGLYTNAKHTKAMFNILSTLEFVTYLQFIFNDIYVNSSIKRTNGCKDAVNNRTLWVSGNRQIERLMDWLYKDATIYMPRKHDKYLLLKSINEGKDNGRKEKKVSAKEKAK